MSASTTDSFVNEFNNSSADYSTLSPLSLSSWLRSRNILPCLFIIIPCSVWCLAFAPVFTAAAAVAAVSATARLDPRCVADHDDDDVAQKEKKKKYSLKCRHLKFRTQVALTHTCTPLLLLLIFPLFFCSLSVVFFYDLFNRLEYVEHLLYARIVVCACVFISVPQFLRSFLEHLRCCFLIYLRSYT